MDTLKQCLRSHPRNLTPNMSLDNGILGLASNAFRCLSKNGKCEALGIQFIKYAIFSVYIFILISLQHGYRIMHRQ